MDFEFFLGKPQPVQRPRKRERLVDKAVERRRVAIFFDESFDRYTGLILNPTLRKKRHRFRGVRRLERGYSTVLQVQLVALGLCAVVEGLYKSE
jgi:hypothetical protein